MEPSNRYPIPAGRYRVEEEIKRSIFITTIAYTPTVEAARAFIGEMRTEFADASHNCWAYLIGVPGSTAQIGMSDDGEPHGTAGRPMLTVLEHSGVGDICAVVTRYFGGTLLGKGGLVKAYSGGVQLALATLPKGEHVPRADLQIVIDYSTVTPFQRLLDEFETEILEQEFGLDVSYTIRLPKEETDAFTGAVTELTSGQALWEVVREDM